MHHHRRDVPVLLAAQHLRPIQVHRRMRPRQPRMHLGPRQPRPQGQHEPIVCPPLGHRRQRRVHVEGLSRLLLQPHVRERRPIRHHHFGHAIMQIRALSPGNLQHSQPRPHRQLDPVPRMEVDRPMPFRRHAQQQQRPRIHPGPDPDLHPILGQHRVQGHHRQPVEPRLEPGRVRKTLDLHPVRRRRQPRLIPPIHQHQAR